LSEYNEILTANTSWNEV